MVYCKARLAPVVSMALTQSMEAEEGPNKTLDMSCDMRFPTMWYVRPAKPQISLRIR